MSDLALREAPTVEEPPTFDPEEAVPITENASVHYGKKLLIFGSGPTASIYDLSNIRDLRHVPDKNRVPETWLIGMNGRPVGTIPQLNHHATFLLVQSACLPITRANGGD